MRKRVGTIDGVDNGGGNHSRVLQYFAYLSEQERKERTRIRRHDDGEVGEISGGDPAGKAKVVFVELIIDSIQRHLGW